MKSLSSASVILLLSGAAGGAGSATGALTIQIAASATGPANTITVTDESGAGDTDYPLQFGRPFFDGAIPFGQLPQVLVNGTAVPTQADVKNRYPDGSVEFAVVAAVIPRIPAGGTVQLTFEPTASDSNVALTAAQMLDASYNFDAQEQISVAAVVGLTPTATADATARTMLQNGDYTLWTSGPVAQTIMLADDSPARKYDIGFGDGYHPFRPRYYATFWPQTHQVFIRAVGESDLTTELEDLAYRLTITGGRASPAAKEPAIVVHQSALTVWSKTFWLGGTPNPQVNIDNNLAYLESTRFIANYDPSLELSQATIAADYAGWWTGTSHDIGGAGAWQPAMGAAGARGDIGPEPSWDAAWLYTGDWRMRQAALGNADLAAGGWSVNSRETNPSKRLNRADPVPVSPAVGSGYGEPISITDRLSLGPSGGGEGYFLYDQVGGPATDFPNVVGAVAINPNTGGNGGGWTYDNSHEPSPFYVPYILTGDPFYLGEMENWAAYDATTNHGSDNTTSQGRGPTGAEGGADNQLRGDGWILRSRAEAAFAAPDGDPEKTYLRILANEDIARWEGGLGVTGTVFDGSAEKVWAASSGDPESGFATGGINTPPPAALGNWEANIALAAGDAPSYEAQGIWTSSAITADTSPWMQWYVQYALGRAAELGFAAKPLALHSGQYLLGMINNSGHPGLIAAYRAPAWLTTGPLASWPAMEAVMSAAYLTSTNPASFPNSSGEAPLAQAFASNLYEQGYDALASAALASLVDEEAPGATQAEAWVKANIYQPLVSTGSWAGDPSWAIVPRTDDNTLPPQPTTPQ